MILSHELTALYERLGHDDELHGKNFYDRSKVKEIFDGADIDVEVKAKVIYEGETEDIINQYIIFCKFFDEQIMKTYEKDLKRETLIEKAALMLKIGKINMDEIRKYFPELLEEDIKELEAEVIQLA